MSLAGLQSAEPALPQTPADAASGKWLSHPAYLGQKYMPSLDGMRGIAVALVVTCHLHELMWTFLSGYVGVTIFFVLSGYLITSLALKEEVQNGSLNVAAFYIRRTFRIVPLYYLVLALYAVLILGVRAWPDKIIPFHQTLPFYLLYLQEIPFWRYNLQTTTGEVPFLHSWSLGIEEKFYLIWPLLMIGIARARTELRLLVASLCAIACVVQGFLTEGRPIYHLQDYGFIFFGVCLALYLWQPSTFAAFQRWSRFALWPAALVALTTQFYLMPIGTHRGLSTMYALAITVLLGALVSSRSVAGRALSWSPLVLLGRLSYAIYLIHRLCIGLVERYATPGRGKVTGAMAYGASMALSAGAAYVLHRIVERPMIRLGRRLSSRAKHTPETA